MIRALACIALLVHTASAGNVWDAAIARGNHDGAQDRYETELERGDDHARNAAGKNISKTEIRQQVQVAVNAYRAAAAAKPTDAEPYFRLGRMLYAFYFEICDRVPPPGMVNSPLCDPVVFDKKRAQEVIDAWNELERLAPLDPRLSVDAGETQILFDRAILHTRLATRPHLEAAAADYEKILARSQERSGQVLGNLAETYMMLGRMDDALETYRDALHVASDTGTWYGYAVVLDRDEQSQQALEVIKSLGPRQLDQFRRDVEAGSTFFVPDGEKFYYFALAGEAFGYDDLAVESWRQFVMSGAHPEFQPRAKAHMDALMRRKKRKVVPFELEDLLR